MNNKAKQKSKINSRRKVAIFDIDGTIFRSSLLIELTEALVQSGAFPVEARNVYAKSYENWLNRQDLYEKYIMAVVKSFLENIKGMKRDDFVSIVKQVNAFHQDRVYRYTRELVKGLKKKKYFLLAISNSPKEMVDAFCKKLGFDMIYGRVYGVDKGRRFTGEILYHDIISDKAKVLDRAITKNNLSLIGSVGVGDSEADIAFLKMVDRPICFNPNKKLYLYAKRKGWEVMVERKDVIYKI